jgi:hypothetical protein
MASPTGAFEVPTFFQDRGIALASLGGAYLALLATALLTGGLCIVARHYLVVSPNRWARDYGIYVSLVLATLLIAVVLENESLPASLATTHYVAMPQLVLMFGLHIAIWRRQEPRLITVGAGTLVATIAVGALLGLTTNLVGPAYWVTLAILAALLAFLWRQAVSTQRGFASANSIYIASKETLDAVTASQKPWLGLPQWVALVTASIALAVGNALLRGRRLEDIPAVAVVGESLLLVLATALVCAVPAVSSWIARKAWMPELTRFVWLVWIVVGFAFTYGNYRSSLSRV